MSLSAWLGATKHAKKFANNSVMIYISTDSWENHAKKTTKPKKAPKQNIT